MVETHSLMSGAFCESWRKVSRVRVGVGQRIAGAGDAEHGHLGDIGRHRHDLLHRLVRGQQLRDHAGAGLIGAVVLAVAVMALNVAGRGHRHMHAGIVVVRLLRIAGVVVDLGADGLGQVRQGVGTAAAPAGCAPAHCRGPVLAKDFQLHRVPPEVAGLRGPVDSNCLWRLLSKARADPEDADLCYCFVDFCQARSGRLVGKATGAQGGVVGMETGFGTRDL